MQKGIMQINNKSFTKEREPREWGAGTEVRKHWCGGGVFCHKQKIELRSNERRSFAKQNVVGLDYANLISEKVTLLN